MQEFVKILIKRLEKEKVDIGEKTGFSKGINKSIEIVNELAEEHINISTDTTSEWIPVSEQLPEGSIVNCLVTLENGAVVPANYIVDEFVRYNTYGIKPFYKNNPVIAWMPMPKGYCPGRTGDEEEKDEI